MAQGNQATYHRSKNPMDDPNTALGGMCLGTYGSPGGGGLPTPGPLQLLVSAWDSASGTSHNQLLLTVRS